MAFTPTDPTQAEVRITGEAPNQNMEVYIPRGAKGEPGGFTQGIDLTGTMDLNDIKTPGLYRNTLASSAKALNNYPVVNASTVVEVLTAATPGDIIQRATPVAGGATGAGLAMFLRRFYGGSWSTWRAYTSTRTDQTAGRAIYQWDEVNSREQLVYGDTGLRDIKAEISSGAANVMNLRRVGTQVSFRLVTWSKDPAGIGNEIIYTLPVGFRPDTSLFSLPGSVRGVATLCQFDVTPAGIISQQAPLSTASVQFNGVWNTTNPWPTILPGTALGIIPNL